MALIIPHPSSSINLTTQNHFSIRWITRTSRVDCHNHPDILLPLPPPQLCENVSICISGYLRIRWLPKVNWWRAGGCYSLLDLTWDHHTTASISDQDCISISIWLLPYVEIKCKNLLPSINWKNDTIASIMLTCKIPKSHNRHTCIEKAVTSFCPRN